MKQEKYIEIPISEIKFRDDESWMDFYDWLEDRFDNRWKIKTYKHKEILAIQESEDLTELKLTWL